MRHKTATIDHFIVMKGEICAILDTGETLLEAGDILVQRGCRAFVERARHRALRDRGDPDRGEAASLTRHWRWTPISPSTSKASAWRSR